MEWLFASLDASRPHEITTVEAWHARFMVFAWGICVPSGIFIARFYKVTPNQDWPRVLDRHSQLKSSMTFSTRNLRRSSSAFDMKSSDHL